MKTILAVFTILLAASFSHPAAAADEVWLCKFKGWTDAGQEYYVVVRPFDGTLDQGLKFNSNEFAQSVFSDLAPGKRVAGGTACAMRARDISETWFKKLLAGDDFFSGRNNTTLAEWRDGRIVKMPWPKAAK